jgi:hypothetical protein
MSSCTGSWTLAYLVRGIGAGARKNFHVKTPYSGTWSRGAKEGKTATCANATTHSSPARHLPSTSRLAARDQADRESTLWQQWLLLEVLLGGGV